MTPISTQELVDWKRNEVTRFYSIAIDNRVKEVLQEVQMWDSETLLKRQGYLQALVDLDPRTFTIEGI